MKGGGDLHLAQDLEASCDHLRGELFARKAQPDVALLFPHAVIVVRQVIEDNQMPALLQQAGKRLDRLCRPGGVVQRPRSEDQICATGRVHPLHQSRAVAVAREKADRSETPRPATTAPPPPGSTGPIPEVAPTHVRVPSRRASRRPPWPSGATRRLT